jgi:hypothetical protein
VKASRHDQRTQTGFLYEMNLLLASLRRVEVRIEPQTITDFLKWKNRMVEYNGGSYPAGLLPAEQEINPHLNTFPLVISATDRLKTQVGLSSEHRNLSGDSRRVFQEG